MGSALVKAHAFSAVWEDTQRLAVGSLREGRPLPNLSKAFAAGVVRLAPTTRFETLVETHLSHPTDSHPTLATRLQALDVDLASLTKDARSVAPEEAAAGLLEDVDRWEEELSSVYLTLLAAPLGIQMRPKAVDRSSPIRRCPHCGTKVLPTKDHRCPSCGQEMH
jgi:rubrerythrin